jgi:hypothetical protein
LASLSLKISVDLHGGTHILKHGFHIFYLVVAHFNLNFFDHVFFGFVGDAGFVQEPVREEDSILLDEGVSAFETAENVDYGGQAFILFFWTNLFKSSLKLKIRVFRYKKRRQFLNFHKILKTLISSFLKYHII